MCDGLPGDIVALALALDVDKIREAGLIREGWQQRLPNNAVVAESVVAIVTRPGNPKNITGWDDLIRCLLASACLSFMCVVPATSTPGHGVPGPLPDLLLFKKSKDFYSYGNEYVISW